MSYQFDELPDSPPTMIGWSGKIAKNVLHMGDTCEVTIPGLDPNIRWKGCYWQSRNSIDLPQRGDKCYVLFDDNNKPWVVTWWPF